MRRRWPIVLLGLTMSGALTACGVPERVFRDAAEGGASVGGAGGGGGLNDGGRGGDGGRLSCDLEEDSIEHCGACGRRCPDVARDDEEVVCAEGECRTRCVDGRSRCGTSGKDRIECVDGVFQYAETCEFVCVDGTCDGTCSPEAVGCSGRHIAVCDDEGQWELTTECPFVCFEGACTGVCEPEDGRCGAGGRETCNDLGQWQAAPCDAGTECVLGACLKSPQEPCASAAECASDICITFFRDADGDGYGSTISAKLCGLSPPSGYTTNDDDCCDSDDEAHPEQEDFFVRERIGCGGHDFNCDDDDEPEETHVSLGCGSTSQGEFICQGWQTAPPDCGVEGQRATTCTCPNGGPNGCPGICAVFGPSTQACR